MREKGLGNGVEAIQNLFYYSCHSSVNLKSFLQNYIKELYSNQMMFSQTVAPLLFCWIYWKSSPFHLPQSWRNTENLFCLLH